MLQYIFLYHIGREASTSGQMNDRPKGKKARSRQKIMHAAKCLFEKDSIEQVTFSEIAKEAGVCRTTVFNHFAGRDQLMLALLEEEVEDLCNYCREQQTNGKTLIRALFDQLIEDTANYPLLTFRLIEGAVISGKADTSFQKISRLIEENLLETDREKRGLQTTVVIGAYYGLINQYLLTGLAFDAPKMQKEYHKILDMVIKED